MKLTDIKVLDRDNHEVSLKDYEGKALLIVNTATGCGFTPQYEGLQKLYEQHQSKGFEILDFRCNQFTGQAPGSVEEIFQFCQLHYHTAVPQFSKIDVNGEKESPLYTYLKSQKNGFLGSNIKWNFTKFLVDKQGNVVGRYAPNDKPENLEKDIVKLL